MSMSTGGSGSTINSNSSKRKPTILAFHGAGSNATIHTIQLARLNNLLKQHVEIKSLDAPFQSNAGPGVLPFFEGCGPYATWLPRSEDLPAEAIQAIRLGTLTTTTHVLPTEIENLVCSTVDAIHRTGGRVVGLIGFSQGARVVAGILRGRELRQALGGEVGEEGAWVDGMGFGVTVCGSWPPPLVPAGILRVLAESSVPAEEQRRLLGNKIAVPALHVLGKQDEEGSWASRALIHGHFDVESGKSLIEECEMGHQYPIAREETDKIRNWIMEVLSRIESDG